MVQGWDGIGWDGMGWDGMALAEGGVGRGLWSLVFEMVASLAVAGLSGGNWLLQVVVAGIGEVPPLITPVDLGGAVVEYKRWSW